MVDAILMAMRKRVQDLHEIAASLGLGKAAALGDAIEQLATMAELHDHVDCGCKGEQRDESERGARERERVAGTEARGGGCRIHTPKTPPTRPHARVRAPFSLAMST